MAQLHSAISGSNGVMGEHLVARLEQLEHRVTRVDRSGIYKGKVNYFFDLAAYGNMVYHDDVDEIYKANLLRTMKSIKNKYGGMVYVSTSSVNLPKQTHYSLSKKMAEDFIKFQVNEINLPIVITRPFTVIGPGEQPAHLIPTLIRSCFTRQEMPFVGEPVHDFIDVRDVCDALIILAQNANKLRGQVFDIGSGEMYTNTEVKEIVEDICGSPANTSVVKKLRSYDTKDWKADSIPLIKLGWNPKYTLRQSIKDMVGEYTREYDGGLRL